MQYDGYRVNKTKDQSMAASKPSRAVAGSKAMQLQDRRPQSVIQRKENNTGLPDQLKSGIERLSGHSMDDVRVHYHSGKPSQLQAHAFAQGTDIHLASGQEKHLPHEAWHVVQQKQGRVKPTMQMKGKVNINDDKALEKEADTMGARAVSVEKDSSIWLPPQGIVQYKALIHQPPGLILPNAIFQRYEGSSIIRPDLSETAVVQMAHYNRLITDPWFNDSRRTINYFSGLFLELGDLASKGALFDVLSVLVSVLGNESWISKLEDAARFVQQHPEMIAPMGLAVVPYLCEKFSLEAWSVNLMMAILSRSALADAIGGHFSGSIIQAITDLAFTMISASSWIGILTTMVLAGIQRRIGRSLVNRGLVFIYSFAAGAAGGIAHRIGGTVGGVVGGAVGGAMGGATVGALAGATLGGLGGAAGSALGLTTGALVGGAVGGIVGAMGGVLAGTHIGEGIKGATSLVSRLWHGLSLTEGRTGNHGPEFNSMPNPYWNPMPLERLHIVPAERGGKINPVNAAHGSAGTNSMMIANDKLITAGHVPVGQPVAIRSQGNVLEAIGMWGGGFLGRGMRTREGFIEHAINNNLHVA